MAAVRAVHDEVLHEDAVDAGVLLHGARQAVAIVQGVEQRVVPHGHDGVPQAVDAVEVVERLALFSGNARAGGVEIAQQVGAAPRQGEALHHAVIVSRAASVVAVPERRGDVAVLRHRRLADRVRDRMAQPLHLGIGAVPRLQGGKRRGHSLPGDDRTVALLVTPQRDARVAGTWRARRSTGGREYTSAADAHHGRREHTDGDESRPAGEFHASHHNTGGGPDGSAYFSLHDDCYLARAGAPFASLTACTNAWYTGSDHQARERVISCSACSGPSAG